MSNEKLRIDKYLWAIRVFKTRTQASEACDSGKVRLLGNAVKPSKNVVVGEEYDIRTPARKWTIKVTGLLANRMAYEQAKNFYIDITSAEDLAIKSVPSSFYTGKRLSKSGRPTKKNRRDLDEFKSGESFEDID